MDQYQQIIYDNAHRYSKLRSPLQILKQQKLSTIFILTIIEKPVQKDFFGKQCLVAFFISVICWENIAAQLQNPDSNTYDYRKVFSFCLDGDVKSALALIEEKNNLTSSAQKFRSAFEQRFKGTEDKSDFLQSKKSTIDDLLKVFHTYWRRSLLTGGVENDSVFTAELYSFLKNNYLPARHLGQNKDSVDVYLRKYIEERSLHTTGFGKTGRLFDLLVWTKEKDTTYTFRLYDDVTSARVILMDDFVTLGWEEYATLGRYYPGGWATKEALYCVVQSYDLNSERFRISYLAHESRHFADYKLFPDLKSVDLEYRAKLVELSMAQTTLYDLIDFFIANAKKDSENAHPLANYRVMQDLSKEIFKIPFEKDITKWKTISPDKINKAAFEVLHADTQRRRIKD